LSVDYASREGPLTAVRNVDLSVARGQFLAIVGESGSGKSTLCNAVARLLPTSARVTAGEVLFKGRNVLKLKDGELRRLRWTELAVVMQSAMSALNPVLTIGEQFDDAIRAHKKPSRGEVQAQTADALEMVGIAARHAKSYPHELSGGMRQRAMIALALAFRPDLLLMDEPTSALDVVAQRALMSEIKALQEELGFAVMFVTHDISVVSSFSDRVAVMYAGELMEENATENLFSALHPYTVALLDSFPSIATPRSRLEGIRGAPPNLRALPAGCSFSPRCPSVMPQCHEVKPPLVRVAAASVRCLKYDGTPHGHK
jgi:peptide/nickel transport system ATP-binding protein